MSKVNDILSDLTQSLNSEFNLKEPVVIFLEESVYIQYCKSWRAKEVITTGNFGHDGDRMISMTFHTPNGLIKIYNKNELYALTRVIDKICEV